MNDIEDLGFAVIDTKRAERTGYPEVIYCKGKTVEQSEAIITSMYEKKIPVLATRACPELGKRICSRYSDAEYDEISGVLTVNRAHCKQSSVGDVCVVSAGTSDLSVSREAFLTSQFLGSKTSLITDVGVAGIHRLFNRLPELRASNVIVAIAGMEGALASVIAGLVDVPVIAVPTSVGYGANFGGLSSLLGMLTACAPGIATVNIDNGFGAGYMANLINQRTAKVSGK